jgi:predicted ATPase
MSIERPNNWYVITGGPSSGKTSIINELNRRGFSVVKEAARTIIDEGILGGKSIEHIRGNVASFQEQILQRKLANEVILDPDVVTFLDRGIHETQAQLVAHNITLTPGVAAAIALSHYRKIFLLDPLPEFTEDYARIEKAESDYVQSIHGLIRASYVAAEQTIIPVPVMTVEERTEFILDQLD